MEILFQEAEDLMQLRLFQLKRRRTLMFDRDESTQNAEIFGRDISVSILDRRCRIILVQKR